MSMPESSNVERLDTFNRRLQVWGQRQVTGSISIRVSEDLSWCIYFFMGRLVWATGGRYPYRRWQRLVRQHCPDWYQELKVSHSPEDYCQAGDEYALLTHWLNQRKLTGEQAANLTRGLIAEVLFDILRCEETKTIQLEERYSHGLSNFVTLLNVEQMMCQAVPAWRKWKGAGLMHLSPDLAPKVRHRDALKANLTPQSYQLLVKLLNGEHSLRDVSLILKQDVVNLIRTLAPYIRKKHIELIRISDLKPPTFSTTVSSELASNSKLSSVSLPLAVAKQTQPPLIVSVDDSYLEKQILEGLLTDLGYRFLGIEDAVQALPVLVETQPALIFLDLVMPIANGYEICAQIRKISKLKDTPVVILTSNDGIVDRVRAKLVGATDFLGKPIDKQQVKLMLQRYIPQTFPIAEQTATSN